MPSRSSSASEASRCCHCMLDGMSWRVPAGTPCSRKGVSAVSGSLVLEEKACSSFSLNG